MACSDPAPTSRRSRRQFLARTAQLASLAACPGLASAAWAEESASTAPVRGAARHCIFLWLGGGACHIDTFDPKVEGDPKANRAGSYYSAIPTAIAGTQVCQHLSRTAPRLDRAVLVRSLHHDVVDEHAAATNRLHTGRPTVGTTLYPSIGSMVAHELPAEGEAPAYVVIGYPSASRGPGFLGARYGYVYLTDTEAGPAGLARPADISHERHQRRQALRASLADRFQQQTGDSRLAQDYIAASEEGWRLAGPEFLQVFDLHREPAELRTAYGAEFGQRCLLARRLVQAGARFVEVSFNLNFINGTGWDTHNEGQLNQHLLIEQLDQALSSLLDDLQSHRLLDATLVVVATEFGRPPEFDAGGGRGHHSKAFSGLLAGGGLRTGQTIGATDELGKSIVQRPVSIADFHATILSAMGIDPAKELYDGERPVPLTDRGQPIRELFV